MCPIPLVSVKQQVCQSTGKGSFQASKYFFKYNVELISYSAEHSWLTYLINGLKTCFDAEISDRYYKLSNNWLILIFRLHFNERSPGDSTFSERLKEGQNLKGIWLEPLPCDIASTYCTTSGYNYNEDLFEQFCSGVRNIRNFFPIACSAQLFSRSFASETKLNL